MPSITQRIAVCLIRDRCVLQVWICLSCLQHVCQHQCSWTCRTPNSSLWYPVQWYVSSLTVKEVKELQQLAHTHGSQLFYHVPRYPETVSLVDLMVCQRLGYRISWAVTFCEVRYRFRRYSMYLKPNSAFSPIGCTGQEIKGSKWDLHHWELCQLTHWRHFLFPLLCDLEFDEFRGLGA